MNSNISEWHNYKLRVDWVGHIYTVISLREEDMGEDAFTQHFRAMETMKLINEYLTKLDIQELIFPSIEKIPDTRSYLVVYTPLFRELTVKWILWKLAFLAGTIVGIVYSAKLIF